MDIKLEKKFDFIPEWNNNKQEDEPVVFHCQLLTVAEYEGCMKVGDTVTIDRRAYLKKSILKIDNLSVGGKPIYDADEFLRARGVSALFTEVSTHLLTINSEEPGKN